MDPNSIQPVQSPPTFTPTPVPSATDSDKGIPIFVLVILLVAVIGSLVFLYFFLQKNMRQTISTPTTPSPQELTPSSITTAPTPTATPTARPTGPGQYACSALGGCKDWNLQIQKENCTVTFADRNCLDQCSDTIKRCKI